jgi:hypothetical protein
MAGVSGAEVNLGVGSLGLFSRFLLLRSSVAFFLLPTSHSDDTPFGASFLLPSGDFALEDGIVGGNGMGFC